MAAGRVGSDVMIGYDSEPGSVLASGDDTVIRRYHDKVWATRRRRMRFRSIPPVWGVLLLTAAGFIASPALVEREKPWLVLESGLALAALTGAIAALCEQRLRAEREVDRIFTLSPDPIAIVGPDGYFVRVNPALAHLLGYTDTELRSRPTFDFIHPEDHERSRAAGQSVHEAGEVVGFENRYVCKDGSLKWLEWTVTLAPDDAAYAVARDMTERRDRDTEQASLRRIATLVAQHVTPAEIFASVSAEVDRVFGLDAATFDLAVVGRFEPGPELVVVGVSKRIEAVPLGSRWPPDELFAPARVLRTGRTARIRADDLEAAAGTEVADFLRHHGYLSQVASPIVVDGRLWGAMSVNSRNELPPDTEGRLENFTELVATAIANADSCEARALLTEEQAALRRVATLVARDAPPGEIFDAVAMEVAKLLGSDITVVGRYDGDGAATAIGSWSASPGGVPKGTRSVVGDRNVLTLVAQTEKPARVDGYHEPWGEAVDILCPHGWRSSIAAPILVEGRLWGVMLVATQRPELFPAAAEQRLAAFTDLVSSGVANAQGKDEVRRFGDEQAALGRVATLVAAGAAPAQVFTAVVEEVSTLLGLERIELVRYDGAIGRVIAASGQHPFAAGSTWSLDDPSVMATVARTKRAARIDDYSALNGEIARTARDGGFQSAVGAPMTVEGCLWGVIIAISTDLEPIPERSKARLGQFADLVAAAIANAEGKSELAESRRRIVAAADEARRRIERDLHDGVQQQLVSLRLELGGMKADPPTGDALREQLVSVSEDVRSVFDALLEIARGIHPAILSQGGLAAALRALARRSAVPVELYTQIEDPLPDELEVTGYYVVAEALTNAVKHARASVIHMDVTTDDGTLMLMVRDDGVGGADPGAGSGLVGLQDRVGALGGAITIDSSAGRGTCVVVTLPIAAAPNHGIVTFFPPQPEPGAPTRPADVQPMAGVEDRVAPYPRPSKQGQQGAPA